MGSCIITRSSAKSILFITNIRNCMLFEHVDPEPNDFANLPVNRNESLEKNAQIASGIQHKFKTSHHHPVLHRSIEFFQYPPAIKHDSNSLHSGCTRLSGWLPGRDGFACSRPGANGTRPEPKSPGPTHLAMLRRHSPPTRVMFQHDLEW